MATALSIAYDVLLTAGVALLGIGFFWKDRRSHLVRNVLIISRLSSGDPFELVHNWYGKTLSLGVLLVLIFVAFRLLPELYLNINGLFELPWRKRPRHDYQKFVGRLSRKKKEGPTTPEPGKATGRSDGTGGDGRIPPSSP